MKYFQKYMCRFTLCFWGTFFSLFPLIASAQETSSEMPQPGIKARLEGWIDHAHQGISKTVVSTSERFDAFFGDERVKEEEVATQLKVIPSLTWCDGEAADFSFPISLTLALPHLKNRWHLMVDTVLKDESAAEKKEDNDDDGGAESENDVVVGLRYKILRHAKRWLSVSGGVKIHSDNIVDPFVRLRFRRLFDFDVWALRYTQYFFWIEEKGWGELSRWDIDRNLRYNILLRLSGSLLWAEREEGVKLKQVATLRRQLSRRRAIGLEVSGKASTHPSLEVQEVAASVIFRRRLYKDWAFFEVKPGIQALHKDDFDIAPRITLNFEFTFGDLFD